LFLFSEDIACMLQQLFTMENKESNREDKESSL
jgi:hypothetical protein